MAFVASARHILRASIQPGDLVFFNASGPGASQVGIAASNGTAISATTRAVMEHSIDGSHWGALLTAQHKVATPVNWQQGDDVVIAGSVSDDVAKEIYPDGWESAKPYIRVVPQPNSSLRIR